MPLKIGAAAGGVQAIKPSDVQLHNNATERTTTSTSAVKLKETRIVVSGWIRTSFDMKCSNATRNCHGQVYRNGVAVGSLRGMPYPLGWNNIYKTFTEDLLFYAGDLYQIYAYVETAGDTVYVQNQKVEGTLMTDYEDTVGY